jgi:hypothetical protein
MHLWPFFFPFVFLGEDRRYQQKKNNKADFHLGHKRILT